MTADNRTVATDALATLGTILTGDEKRDAIHIAVIACEAGEVIDHGDDVCIRDGKAYSAHNPRDLDDPANRALGIADPFLPGRHIHPGERFWLLIYPRVITSLRHVWTHPAITDEAIGPPPGLTVTLHPAGPPATFDLRPSMEQFVERQKKDSEAWLRKWCEEDGQITYDELIEVVKTGNAGHSDHYGARWTFDGHWITSHGRDASGDIPKDVWMHLRNVTGVDVPDGEEHFNCSC